MPFTTDDVEKHTKKAKTAAEKRQWVAVANSVLDKCIEDGGTDETCAPKAITQANGVIAKQQEAAMPAKDIDYFISLAEQAIETAQGAVNGGTRTMKELAEKNGKTVAEVAARLLGDISAELAEAKKMKTVGGEKYPASDFLVVEDPESPSTWHLQVKKGGKVDHALMGAAKAALTSPGGHRGQKYAGPDKEKAISALKALYKAEDMPWSDGEKKKKEEYAYDEPEAEGYGTSEVDGDLHDIARGIEDAFDAAYAPETRWRDGIPARYSTRSVFMGHPEMGDSIIVSDRDENKIYAVKYEQSDDGIEFSPRGEWQEVKLSYKFIALRPQSQEPETMGGEEAQELEEVEVNETAGTAGVTITGHALGISEIGDVANGGTKPLKMEVVPIRPGWGNRRDNNYYSETALKNGAPLFSKVKMFETNHIEAETNNRNWVSTIIDTSRFTESGEPISVVGVHDPAFAQKVLNLSELNLLGMLECSIRGHGRVRQGDFELGGRKGKYVEELTDISSVDWVSKAGAGGRALGLTENETGGTEMPETEKGTMGEQPSASEEPATEVALGEESAVENQEPQALTEAEIAEALSEIALPEHTKALLSAREYANSDELGEVVKQVVAEFKQATGSGNPVATRSKKDAQPKAMTREAIEKTQDAVNQRYLRTRISDVKEEQK